MAKFKKGEPRPESAGRKAGTPNKRSFDAKKMAEELGIDPFEILLHIAAANWDKLGYKMPFVTKVNMGIEYEEDVISLSDRLSAAKEATKYIYSQLKSIEVSTKEADVSFAERLMSSYRRAQQTETLVGSSTSEESERH